MSLFIDNYRRYSEHATIWDLFKVVALVSMIFGHIGSYFVPDEQWYRMIGRVCVPIWFFLAGFGYRPHQRNTLELLLLGSTLVLVDYIFNDPLLPMNILFTHVAGRFFLSFITSYDRDVSTLTMLTVVLLALWLPSNIMFEYGTEVFLFMLVGFYAANEHKKLATQALIVSTLIYLPSQILAFQFTYPQAMVVALMVLLTVIALYGAGIKYKTFKNPLPKMGGVNQAVKMIARNTLAIYALHASFFVMAAWVLDENRQPIMTIGAIIK